MSVNSDTPGIRETPSRWGRKPIRNSSPQVIEPYRNRRSRASTRRSASLIRVANRTAATSGSTRSAIDPYRCTSPSAEILAVGSVPSSAGKIAATSAPKAAVHNR